MMKEVGCYPVSAWPPVLPLHSAAEGIFTSPPTLHRHAITLNRVLLLCSSYQRESLHTARKSFQLGPLGLRRTQTHTNTQSKPAADEAVGSFLSLQRKLLQKRALIRLLLQGEDSFMYEMTHSLFPPHPAFKKSRALFIQSLAGSGG